MRAMALNRLGQRVWFVLASLGIGAAAFLFSDLFEPAQTKTWFFGEGYARMADAPFACDSTFPHRILGPLLAHVLGFGSAHYWLFSHVVLVLLFAALAGQAVRTGTSWAGASLLVATLSLTRGPALFKGFVGYTEPLSLLLLVSSLAAVNRPVWFWSIQLLSLLNHEQILFFWPWLLLQRRLAGGSWRADAVGAAAVAGLYALFRWLVDQHAPAQLYTPANYIGWIQQPPLVVLGMTVVTVVMLLIAFGVLPALLAWHAAVDRRRVTGFGIALFLASMFALCCIALDVFRFVAYALIPIWLAGIELVKRRRGAWIFAGLGAVSGVVLAMSPSLFGWLLGAFMANQPDPASALIRTVIPEHPERFVAIGLAVLAIAVAGWIWGRRDRRRSAT